MRPFWNWKCGDFLCGEASASESTSATKLSRLSVLLVPLLSGTLCPDPKFCSGALLLRTGRSAERGPVALLLRRARDVEKSADGAAEHGREIVEETAFGGGGT